LSILWRTGYAEEGESGLDLLSVDTMGAQPPGERRQALTVHTARRVDGGKEAVESGRTFEHGKALSD
jgi:hypothetical protein